MARFLKSREKAKGAAPGSLIFMGSQKMEASKIRLFKFNANEFYENEFSTTEEGLNAINHKYINWLNVDGLHDVEVINSIGKHFNISPLVLENILNTGQRARFIEDTSALTVLTKAVTYIPEENKISVEQISFVLIDNVVISFQERIGDHFDPVRERIRSGLGRIRTWGADYLVYALLDCLVDNYMIHLEQIGDKVETLEEDLINPTNELSRQLFKYKTELLYFRKAIKPLKEVLTRVLRCQTELIQSKNIVFFQEIYDIEEQAIEASEYYFGIITDMINLYNTNLSNKANEVMKVLTIFASIFIPLTFIAGIYGTNFDYLPELHYKYAYFMMWGAMAVVTTLMLYYFRRRKWF